MMTSQSNTKYDPWQLANQATICNELAITEYLRSLPFPCTSMSTPLPATLLRDMATQHIDYGKPIPVKNVREGRLRTITQLHLLCAQRPSQEQRYLSI